MRAALERLVVAGIARSIVMKQGGSQNVNEARVIADYLIESGVILPPCKVGDIVFANRWYWREDGGTAPYQITNITITQNKKGVWTKKYRAMQLANGRTIDLQLNFEFDEIGKSVFLTREEAEQALAERKTNE